MTATIAAPEMTETQTDPLYEPHTLTLSERLADAEQDVTDAEMERYFRSEAKRVQRLDDPEETRREKARLIAEACGRHPFPGEGPYYTAEQMDGELRLRERMCYAIPQTGPSALLDLYQVRQVPNLRVRDEFLRQYDEHTAAQEDLDPGERFDFTRDFAERIGEYRTAKASRHNGRRSAQRIRLGDATRVERLLGLEVTPTGEGRPPQLRLFLPAEMVARIADALDMTYQDAGV